MTRSIDAVLVTGGAGFIGSHTVDLLVKRGYSVVVMDALDSQVHGLRIRMPSYLNRKITFWRADVRDRRKLRNLLKETDAVIHLASMVGVGQSMYEIERYVDANSRGTASLLDALVREDHHVKKLIVASSMSIYGEGKYHCKNCGEHRFPGLRKSAGGMSTNWEHVCPECSTVLKCVATDEGTPLRPTSVYAYSKRHQEELCLLIGRTYGIPTVALRYFNVYGPRQSMSNPYTGAAAIFLSRILNHKAPYVFEDGGQTRDFVYVGDIARANVAAMEKSSGNYEAINIGTGVPTSIGELARRLVLLCGMKVKPRVTHKFRTGDVRHCFADPRKAELLLGFRAGTRLDQGLPQLVSWAKANRRLAKDRFAKALEELRAKELTGSP